MCALPEKKIRRMKNREIGYALMRITFGVMDYKPADRPKYIEAFFSNIDWSVVERRLHRLTGKPVSA